MTPAVTFSYAASGRLKKRWEFDAVFRTGRQQRGALVRMYFLYRPGEAKKFGVVVGKKIANAVERARGRRILRESLRRLTPWIAEGVWVVFSLREKALDKSAVPVYRDIAGLLKRADLLNDEWGGLDWHVDEI